MSRPAAASSSTRRRRPARLGADFELPLYWLVEFAFQCRIKCWTSLPGAARLRIFAADRPRSARKMHQDYDPFARSTSQREASREMESLLWLAAGAAWAIVAIKAWSQ